MSDCPGSFFLARITGRTGWAVGVGQALAGEASRWTHAGIILAETGTILEAEPGPHGARIGTISEYAGRPLLISDGPVQRALDAWSQSRPALLFPADRPHMEAAIRSRVVVEARKLVGVPYSGLDYLALALLHLGLPDGWVRRRVQASGHMQCAQLVDAAYRRAGIRLWDDGRLPGDVMPADLAAWAEDWTARQPVPA
jgi:hypothetical protein